MAIDTTAFQAEFNELSVYNAKAVVDLPIYYYLDDDDSTAFTFPGYQSSYLYVYDSEERSRIVKSFTTQVSRNANCQVINASVSDMTFEDQGTYYYELGFVSSGYEISLRYGPLYVI